MRYETPAALRHAIDDRLRAEIRVATDPMRLRRRIVFERMLRRLEATSQGRWVLKGGMALEARYRERSRTTKDLDLALATELADGAALHGEVVHALAVDPDGDWFVFEVDEPTEIAPDEAGRPGWRLTVRAILDGRLFAAVRVDVVARPDELASTERIVMPNTLAFAGVPDVEVEVVDLAQHFAEKLHAFTREYGDRPNTRVKDLTDLVLLVEVGLEPDAHVLTAVEHVFEARGTHAVPVELPVPPAAWDATYAIQAEELQLVPQEIADAARVVDGFWSDVRRSNGPA